MWDMSDYKLEQPYPALLLAGGTLNGKPKAFLPILDKPMIWYFLRAISHLRDVLNPILVVAPEENWDLLEKIAQELNLELSLAPPGENPMDSFLKGLNVFTRKHSLPEESLIWAFATDTPLIKPEMIRDVIYRGDMLKDSSDLFYVVVSKEPYKAKFPESKRTFLKLRRGTFCGTGIIGLRIGILEELSQIGEGLVKRRKSPFAMASLLGWDLLLGVAFGSYTLLDLEEKISKRFKIRGKVLLSEYPEIAFNVDDEEELKLAEMYLRGGEKAHD